MASTHAPAQAPSTAPATETKEKKGRKKAPAPEFYPSPDEAKKVAEGRETGARQAFTVKLNGKVEHCVAVNFRHAALAMLTKHGGEVSRIDAPERAPKALSVDQAKELLGRMSDEDRAAILATLKTLGKK